MIKREGEQIEIGVRLTCTMFAQCYNTRFLLCNIQKMRFQLNIKRKKKKKEGRWFSDKHGLKEREMRSEKSKDRAQGLS